MATLDPRIQRLLNDFSKSQPALQLVGVPASRAGVQLGDLLAQALADSASTESFSPATPGNWSPTPTTVKGALDQAAPGLSAADATTKANAAQAAAIAAAAADATTKANAAATAGHEYTAAAPSEWAGSPPTTDTSALDRLAAAVYALQTSTPIA